ncbi:unnamed protein product [Meloidogyne enterolobii]|uniref:Uncharacterized protein n=1 Tax=Meloidogyne enterolobii TaxID=390850 RepID=A0ACB0Y9I5_MELEN
MEVVPIQQNLNDQENDLNNKGNPLPIVQLFSSNFDLNPILSKKQTGDSFFSPQHPINSGISPVEQYGGPNFGYKPSQNLHMGGANYNNQHHAQPTVHNPRGQIIVSL